MPANLNMTPHLRFLLPPLLICLAALGCGSTKQHTVTEQLLTSDAVDRAVAQIDFRVLSGRKVYLDTSYIQPIKNIGFVNDRYIVSALRQQIAAAGCLLQDSAADADVILEPRVGALGTELHEVVYGMPSNNVLASVASISPNSPPVPVIPEISLAKKNQHLGAAKIAVFAYERESKDPLWQSGIAQAESRARDMWVLGAGPFQDGTIYDQTYFAGSEIDLPLVYERTQQTPEAEIGFDQPFVFADPNAEELPGAEESSDAEVAKQNNKSQTTTGVRPVNHEEPTKKERPPARKRPADKVLAGDLMRHLEGGQPAPRKRRIRWYDPLGLFGD